MTSMKGIARADRTEAADRLVSLGILVGGVAPWEGTEAGGGKKEAVPPSSVSLGLSYPLHTASFRSKEHH